MPLPPTPSASTDWRAEIAELARAEDNGEIQVLIPGKPGAYNPVTDANDGAGYLPPTVLIPTRPARIQDLSFSEQNGAADPRGKQRFRFQCDPEPGVAVTDTAVVKVISFPRDPSLTGLTFPVTIAAVTARLTIETTVEAAGG